MNDEDSGLITVVETDAFTEEAEDVLTLQEHEKLVTHLAIFPEAGVVIPGTGGIRKIRWAARGHGKRGGARVIYFYHSREMPVYVLAVYAKGDKDDLTEDEKKEMRELTAKIVKSYKDRRGRGRRRS